MLTDDGRVLSGVKLRQTDTDLILRNAEDREISIPLNEIEEQKDGGSLMPAGLIDELTRTELVDLVRFLSELGKQGDFAIGSERLVRRWEVLQDTPGNRASSQAESNWLLHLGTQLQWGPNYSRVSGELALERCAGADHRRHKPYRVVRFELDVTHARRISIGLNDLKDMPGFRSGSMAKLYRRRPCSTWHSHVAGIR